MPNASRLFQRPRWSVNVLRQGGWVRIVLLELDMTEDEGHWSEPILRLDEVGTIVEDLRETETKGVCQDCKWWIEQGPRTKDIDFQLTLIGWCKRMPRTETDKDKDDWCGEFQPR